MEKDNIGLRFLYCTAVGRIFLKAFSGPFISKTVGRFLDSPLSRILIPYLVKKNGIDLSEYENPQFSCFNDYFCRRIKPELRPVDACPEHLISPCDGLLSVYPICNDTVLPIKQSHYTLLSLLRDDALAEQYRDGICMVFRLKVDHYHHYCYAVSGEKSGNTFLKGKLHTVRPIALERIPVFTENCREYTVIDSPVFGKVLQMEIGAMMVGKIRNLHNDAITVERGTEKGMFLYGGSSILLLLKKDSVSIPSEWLKATENGTETPVRYGQMIGIQKNG